MARAAKVGSTSSVSTVAVINPPMTTVASGFCTSAPAPTAIAIGMKPTMATSAVVSTASSEPEVRVSRGSTLGRGLRLIGASLAALYTAALGIGMIADTLPGGPPVLAVLAVAQAVPVVVVIYRPAVAWWLSLQTALPYLIYIGRSTDPVAAETFWPWTAAGIFAHLFVSLVAAYREAREALRAAERTLDAKLRAAGFDA